MTSREAAERKIALNDLAATERLAHAIAARARRGDAIALSGGLGVGKTTLARAFLRARPGGAALDEIPSPTYTLVQTYDLPGTAVRHFDLYRLNAPGEAAELGIEEAVADGIALIEWPERLAGALPPGTLIVTLASGDGPEARVATLAGGGDWPARLADLER